MSAPAGPGGPALLDGPALLEVQELSVHYGGLMALDDVSLSVGEGEVVGLIGPNGAGKTTCLDALTGFAPVHRGTVRFGGRRLDGLAPHQRSRRGFVRTFQSLDLFEDLTVAENLAVGASTPTWWSTVTDALWPKHTDQAAVDEALELVGLSASAGRHPSELSNGDRHLVALGRALVARPRLVLLDEPAAGLDSHETEALGRLLRSLPDRGVAVLLVDHDMALVLGVCDRVHVLDVGRILASGTPAEVRADRRVVAAYLGTADAGAAVDGDPDGGPVDGAAADEERGR